MICYSRNRKLIQLEYSKQQIQVHIRYIVLTKGTQEVEDRIYSCLHCAVLYVVMLYLNVCV